MGTGLLQTKPPALALENTGISSVSAPVGGWGGGGGRVRGLGSSFRARGEGFRVEF